MRLFDLDGTDWVAWPSGGGAYGTGVLSPGNIEAIHFAPSDAREVPRFEALLPAGTFWDLFDEELVGLFRSAREIVIPDQLPERRVTRRLGDQS